MIHLFRLFEIQLYSDSKQKEWEWQEQDFTTDWIVRCDCSSLIFEIQETTVFQTAKYASPKKNEDMLKKKKGMF